MSVIFFDLDGTLTDPADGITACIRYALQDAGVECPQRDELLSFIGPPLHVTFAALLNEDPAAVDRAIGKYRERFVDVGMFENRVYDGIPECLAALGEDGFRLAVATSKPHVYARRIVDHFELSQFFESVFGPELDGTRTSKTELLAHALKELHLSPSECLMVGDREHDIIGAKNNSIPAVAVSWGYGSHQEHIAAGADAHVGLISELRKVCLASHPKAPTAVAGRG